MSSIFASKAVAGKPRCARCKRPFTPRKEGGRYGPKCARIIAGHTDLSALDHVDRTDAGGEPGDTGYREIRNSKGEVTAVIV